MRSWSTKKNIKIFFPKPRMHQMQLSVISKNHIGSKLYKNRISLKENNDMLNSYLPNDSYRCHISMDHYEI